MKNKIVIGLGLMLGVTVGISFADDMGTLTGPTEKISPSSPARIDTSSLTANKYYDITCTFLSLYKEKDILMFDRVHSKHGTEHNMGPVLVNGVRVEPVHNHIETMLNPGMNTVVFQQFVVEGNTHGSHIDIQAKNNRFYLQGCHYEPALSVASNGTAAPIAPDSTVSTAESV